MRTDDEIRTTMNRVWAKYITTNLEPGQNEFLHVIAYELDEMVGLLMDIRAGRREEDGEQIKDEG